MGRRAVVLLVAGLALLWLAWSFGTPLGAGPDEPAHYVRALAVGGGHPLGQPGVWHEPEFPLSPLRQADFNANTTRLSVPVRLEPTIPTLPCYAFHPDLSAACSWHLQASGRSDVTYVGRYQPLYYVAPGVVARWFDAPAAALRAARIVSGLMCLALLAIAAWFARGVAGLLLALSPMVLSLTGTLTSSAFEVTSAIAFTVTTIALLGAGLRRRGTMPAWVISGICLAWSRPLGAAWVLAIAVVVAIGFAGDGVRARARSLAAPAGLVATAAVGSAIWSAVVVGHVPSVPVGLSQELSSAVHTYWTTFREQVGVFGWLDTWSPAWTYPVWAIAVGGLVLLALVRGTTRQRIGLLLAAVVYFAAVFEVNAHQIASGVASQGRYTLPILVLPVLLAGEVLRQDRRVVLGAGAAFLVVNLAALYENGRRFAVGGAGRDLYLTNAQWSPPGGWLLWTAVAVAGAAAIAAGTVAADVTAGQRAPDFGSGHGESSAELRRRGV